MSDCGCPFEHDVPRTIAIVFMFHCGEPLPWAVTVDADTKELGSHPFVVARFETRLHAKLFVAALAAEHRGEFPAEWKQ